MADAGGEKHLGVERRRRRFEPAARHGGHGGASTVRARPLHWLRGVRGNADALADLVVRIDRPVGAGGDVLVTQLDLQVPDLLARRPADLLARTSIATAAVARPFRVAEQIEAAGAWVSTQNDPSCPDVLVTTYAAQGVAWVASGELDKDRLVRLGKAALEGGGDGVVSYALCRRRQGANVRWAPAGCGACRLGCAKCKRFGMCKSWRAGRALQRRRCHQEEAGLAAAEASRELGGSAAAEEGEEGEQEEEGDVEAEEEVTTPATEAAAAEQPGAASPSSGSHPSVGANWAWLSSASVSSEDSDWHDRALLEAAA